MVGEMTPRKRVFSALMGGRVDRIPAIALSNFCVELMDAAGVSWPDCQTKSEEMAKLQAARYEVYGLDSLCSHNDLVSDVEPLGARISLGKRDRHLSVASKVFGDKEPKDVGMPDRILETGRIPMIERVVEILSERYRDILPVLRLVMGPMTNAGHAFGIERVLEWSKTNPDKFQAALNFMADLAVEIMRESMRHGADILYMPDPSASGDLLSPEAFKEFLVPAYRKIISKLGGIPTFLHICGHTGKFLELIPETGFNGFSFEVPGVSVEETKSAIGDRISLIGSVQTLNTLLGGTPETVRKESLQQMLEGVDLLCPACGLPNYTPNKNVIAMVEAAKEYGIPTSVDEKMEEFLRGIAIGISKKG